MSSTATGVMRLSFGETRGQLTHSVLLQLREGVAQGDPLATAVFCLSTLGVLKAVCKDVGALAPAPIAPPAGHLLPPGDGANWQPDCVGSDGNRLQPPVQLAAKATQDKKVIVGAFADDVQSFGPLSKQLTLMRSMMKHGAPMGIKLNVGKSTIVVKTEADRAKVEAILESEALEAKVDFSAKSLGSILGPDASKRDYVEGQARNIAKQLERLVALAPHHPHQVYTVVRLSILPRVIYLQRTTAAPVEAYQAIEGVMVRSVIPYLLQWDLIILKPSG